MTKKQLKQPKTRWGVELIKLNLNWTEKASIVRNGEK